MILLRPVQRLHGDGSKRARKYVRGDEQESQSADERERGCLSFEEMSIMAEKEGRWSRDAYREGNARGELRSAVALSTVCKM